MPNKKLTNQLCTVVLWQLVSLLMELSIDDGNYSLPLRVCMVGFGKQSQSHNIKVITKYVQIRSEQWLY